METPFLKQLASYLFQTYGEKLPNQNLVFPNKRVGLFFTKYLAELLDKPLWSPKITTLNDYFADLSPLHKPDSLALVFKLHQVSQKFTRQGESFDQFYFWGERLLQDFDQIDKQLADVGQLFATLQDQKAIDLQFENLDAEALAHIKQFWSSLSLQGAEKSHPSKQAFLKFWAGLPTIYAEFTALLQASKQGYDGLIQRQVIEDLLAGKLNLPEQPMQVIGFNALSRCEETLLLQLQKEKKACFYWDFDPFYTENPEHQAGLFLRKNLRKFPMPKDFSLRFGFAGAAHKKATVIAVPQESSWARIVGGLLDKLGVLNEKTALVLPDEKMLLPMLDALPRNAADVNVSMGYPLRHSLPFNLIETLLQLQIGSKESQAGKTFACADVLSLLDHPYLAELNIKAEVKKLIQSHHYTDFPIAYFEHAKTQNPLLSLVFSRTQNANSFLNQAEKLLQHLLNKQQTSPEDTENMAEAALYSLYLQVHQMQDLLLQEQISLGLSTLHKLLRRWMEKASIPFTGQPLQGMQIIGLHKTHLLDFDTLFILNMNEGFMPATASNNSFIPFSLRKAFGLTTFVEDAAINAYLFYRLIQRSSRVYLLYSQQQSSGSKAEPSRYLAQLAHQAGFGLFEKQTLGVSVTVSAIKPIVVANSPAVISLLTKYLANKSGNTAYQPSLSPTALSDLLTCRLRFYFKYLAGLKEPELFKPDLDAASFGTIFHDAMEKLYTPYIGKHLQKSDFTNLRKSAEQACRWAFKKTLKLAPSQPLELSGRNSLLLGICLEYVNKMLEQDEQETPFKILHLELKDKALHYAMPFTKNGETAFLALSGRIDRVEEKQGIVRILDYKTGSASRKFLGTLESLFDESLDRTKNKASYFVQTLFYALLYTRSGFATEQPLQPGLVITSELFSNDYSTLLSYQSTPGAGKSKAQYSTLYDCKAALPDFEKALQKLFSELFNPKIPIVQTSILAHCTYCPYTSICQKQA